MKPLYFALTAMFFYAVANIIIETKLAKMHTLDIMVSYSTVIAIIALTTRYLTYNTKVPLEVPAVPVLWGLLAVSLLYTVADWFYFSAYTSGGSVYAVAIGVVMFPIFASVMKLVVTQSAPNKWLIAGYALAMGAVLLVAKGNTLLSE